MNDLRGRARKAWGYAPAWLVWLSLVLVLSLLVSASSVWVVYSGAQNFKQSSEDRINAVEDQLREAREARTSLEDQLNQLRSGQESNDAEAACRSEIVAQTNDAQIAAQIAGLISQRDLNDAILLAQDKPEGQRLTAEALDQYRKSNQELTEKIAALQEQRDRRLNVVAECADGKADA